MSATAIIYETNVEQLNQNVCLRLHQKLSQTKGQSLQNLAYGFQNLKISKFLKISRDF